MEIKYIGMDIHKETISIAVMNGEGRVVMESIIETKASTILQFIQGVHGDLHVTFEEGTWAAWLYDLLKPHVTQLVVCDPRKNALFTSPFIGLLARNKLPGCPSERSRWRGGRCRVDDVGSRGS
jgi:hypothetical protein